MLAVIAITIVIPVVIVLYASVAALPITVVIVLPIMMRLDPGRSTIRRASPVPVVPSVSVPFRVPVPLHPEVTRAG